MSDGDPPGSLWRRLLALPVDSQARTLMMAVAVSAVSAVLVSGAAVLLGPRIDANREAERQARFEAMLAEMPGLSNLLTGATGAGATLETVVVDLESGEAAPGVDPAEFDMAEAATDPERSRDLTPEADVAGIRRVPELGEIHLLREDGELRLVILPIWGSGYQSTIRALLALEGDLETVAALAITEQAETPGLGARITEPAWAALWPGKELTDDSGEIVLGVAKGPARSDYLVDGITGATRTGKGISNMIRFWAGPDGYGPVLDALRDGRL